MIFAFQHKGLAILLLVASSQALIQADSDLQNGRCGGSIEADSGHLTYPSTKHSTDASSSGELCIWTIHLKTTSTFRLNFTSLDVHSDSETCDDSAVRIYSLTNLIPADRAEGYTFCNNKPPSDGPFFLSESLITVIYRSSKNATNAGSGFTLNWEGISVQPIEKTHESTYTTAASGVIRFPVDGQYPPNHVSTWSINSESEPVVGPNAPKTLLSFSYVQTEPCGRGSPEDCLCDAVVLYEVASNGQLEETQRLCGNVTSRDLPEVSPNFILSFFSDHDDAADVGTGFEMVYKPVLKPPVANISKTCGGILSGTNGLIEYKVNESYESNERCVWTVRSEGRTEITFTLQAFGMYYWYDTLEVLAIDSTGNTSTFAFDKLDIGIPMTFNATVALINFYSEGAASSNTTGFSLTYQISGEIDNSLAYYRDTTNMPNKTELSGKISYPENGQQIRNGELSTFVLQHEHIGGYEPMSIRITALNLERDVETGDCRDWIRVYRLHSLPGTMIKLQEISRWPYDGGICQMDELPVGFPNTDYAIVVVLRTDGQGLSKGFELVWNINAGSNNIL